MTIITAEHKAEYAKRRAEADAAIDRLNELLANTGRPYRATLRMVYNVRGVADDFDDDAPGDDGDPRYVPEVAAQREDEAGL
jgi:hypothetical protein